MGGPGCGRGDRCGVRLAARLTQARVVATAARDQAVIASAVAELYLSLFKIQPSTRRNQWWCWLPAKVAAGKSDGMRLSAKCGIKSHPKLVGTPLDKQ